MHYRTFVKREIDSIWTAIWRIVIFFRFRSSSHCGISLELTFHLGAGIRLLIPTHRDPWFRVPTTVLRTITLACRLPECNQRIRTAINLFWQNVYCVDNILYLLGQKELILLAFNTPHYFAVKINEEIVNLIVKDIKVLAMELQRNNPMEWN